LGKQYIYHSREEFEDTKRGNQHPYIEKEQTTQLPKEKVQKLKQRSTKHEHKTNDRVARTPQRTGGQLRCSGSSSFSSSVTCNVNIVTNLVIIYK
jgi:hypothetical protein